jgi:hypothetical protein
MEVTFEFTPKDSFSSKEMIEDLSNQKDFQEYVRHYVGTRLKVDISPTSILSEKERLYSYYHKVVLSVAMQAYSEDGWESMDKTKTDYFLKAECGKDIVYNAKTRKEEIYLLDKSKMNKDRLRKFVYDCIIFLETEKGVRVPDSESYKFELQSGISGFQSTKSKKNT